MSEKLAAEQNAGAEQSVDASPGTESSKRKKNQKKLPPAFSAWTVGYDGLSAIVDKGGAASCRDVSVSSLLAKGMYRAAAALAVNSGSESDVAEVIDGYNRACGSNRGAYVPADIYRLFGVQKLTCERFILL